MTEQEEKEFQTTVLMAMGGKDFGKPGTKVDLLMHHRICKAVRPLISRHRSASSPPAGWRTIDSAPKDRVVLLTDGKSRWMSDIVDDAASREVAAYCGWDKVATHWAELLEPPKP